MTREVTGALSRTVPVTNLPPEGAAVDVETTPEEREALARDFKLPAIHSLTGTLHLSGSAQRVRVTGRIDANIAQICVVTLETFDSDVHEDVDVEFARVGASTDQQEEDPPDEIVNGQIDVGKLTAEFLALGLDPYPRKAGADFKFEPADAEPVSPFAALGKLQRDQ